jgi:hypothetical protein
MIISRSQNRQNQILLLFGNIAAAISADDENYREGYQEEWWKVPQLFPRYAHTRCRQFVI